MASLRFDITGNTTDAQRGLRALASTTDLASRGARLLADSLDKEKRAIDASARATLTLAKTEKILADASDEAIASFAAEREALDRDKRAKEENAAATAALAAETDGAAGSFGALASPMGALAGAGVALAPVIVTVGTGLAGLGIAAAGIVSPILKAAQSTGGLKANLDKLDPAQRTVAQSLLGLQKTYDQFQHSLEPVLIKDFNTAIAQVGPLFHDIQPVAAATGEALAGVLSQLGAEFRSGTWQQFFVFMGRTAAEDVRLLGSAFTTLLDALPRLLQELQPVAIDILEITSFFSKLVDAGAKVQQSTDRTGQHMSALEQITTALRLALFGPGVGLYHALKLIGVIGPDAAKGLQHMGTVTGDLIHPLGSFTVGLQSAKAATDAEKQAVNQLNTALANLSSGLLTSQQDQVAWKQSQQAATQAIKQATGSLDSNRASSLSARSAIIASTQAALAYANQELHLHKNTDAASAIIRAQIRYLQQHAGQSRVAAQEVDALRTALAQLHSKKITITESGVGHFSIFGRNTSSTPKLAGGAQGLFINRGTTPTADDVMVRASKGELIVPTKMVSAGLVDHLRGFIPGFAAGGVAGSASSLPGRTTGFDQRFQAQFTAAMEAAMSAATRAAVNAARSTFFPGSNALGGSAAANRALAMRLFPWPSWMFPSFNYVEMREAGYSLIARNRSSGAYGMAQFINGPSEYYQWGGNPNTAGGQLTGMFNYIRSRYGNPVNAANHERAFNWYGSGGWIKEPVIGLGLRTGRGYGFGERGPEMVVPKGAAGGRMVLEIRTGSSDFDRFLADHIRGIVTDHGGGDVQIALGGAY